MWCFDETTTGVQNLSEINDAIYAAAETYNIRRRKHTKT